MTKKKNDYFHHGHLGEAAVAIYVEELLGDKTPSLPEEVLAHVESCPACKNQVLDVFLFMKNPETIAGASQSPQAKVMPNQEEKIVPLPVKTFYKRKIAAVFIFLAFIMIAYFLVYRENSPIRQYFQNSSTQNASKTVTDILPGTTEPVGIPGHTGKETTGAAGLNKTDTEPVSAKQGRRPGDKFRVNPNLETMIDSPSRSQSLLVQSPANNISLNKTHKKGILFSWNMPRPSPITLKILDNQGELFFSYPMEKTTTYLLFKEHLCPGLYYWKLETKRDLLYVGKFFIK